MISGSSEDDDTRYRDRHLKPLPHPPSGSGVADGTPDEVSDSGDEDLSVQVYLPFYLDTAQDSTNEHTSDPSDVGGSNPPAASPQPAPSPVSSGGVDGTWTGAQVRTSTDEHGLGTQQRQTPPPPPPPPVSGSGVDGTRTGAQRERDTTDSWIDSN